MTQKSASISVRIEPEIKETAEEILSAIGIPVSSAINMFYKQIILHGGLPFEACIPIEELCEMTQLTPEELNREIEKGYQDIVEGRVMPLDEAIARLRKKYGI
ncbi:MAG: type II toxin-antitoxin system RelB/DinJ family antitoxin [Erysipelotrichaceae bacterium]|nr:type II toxin-antitoxin system RelB/DinJ family antitoxin [Erysipelotrichaceae bacterium]